MSISLLSGNKEFIQIYNRYINTVYRVCFMYMKNKQDTEDAVQTTFIKYLEYKGEFKDSEHIKLGLLLPLLMYVKIILNIGGEKL